MTRRYFLLPLVPLLILMGRAQAGTVTCTLDYDLPADIPVSTSNADDDTFQGFGWQSFLALSAPAVGGQISTSGDNVPQWRAWSSSVDMLLCQESPTPRGCVCPNGECAESGARYYPTVCTDVPNYQDYRVIGQVSKVDDSFEQAATGGLSGDAVVDRFSGFLRFEIMVSPATYAYIIENQLYDQAHVMSLTSDINLECGTSSYTGGDPASPDMGALVVKLAWMDVTDAIQSGDIDPSTYHLEQLLLYTPYYRNSTGVPTCDLRTMALVGMHIAHKTVNQPNWIWSTFEHDLNAPDCTGGLPGPGTQQTNTSCPDTVSTNYNFYGEICNGTVQGCQSCNAPPASNGNCNNPTTTVGAGFCLDEPPAANGGISQLCRQVPISDYPQAAAWNTACKSAIGTQSAWGNYSLISSQWGTSAFAAGCANVAKQIAGSQFSSPIDDSLILPRVNAGSATKPILGNTSMESYDRSNCIGCHSKGNFTNDAGTQISTDLMYFLELQVLAPAATRAAYAADIQSGGGGGGGGGGGCQVVAQSDGQPVWLIAGLVLVVTMRRRRQRG